MGKKYLDSWPALPSDPEVLDDLLHSLGATFEVKIEDVLDLNQPDKRTVALIILYPESQEDEDLKAKNEQTRHSNTLMEVRRFIPQTIDNTCGMVAILNGVINSLAYNYIAPNSVLGKVSRDEFDDLVHLRVAYNQAGGFEENDEDGQTHHHYTVLIEEMDQEVEGGTMLIELDGERKAPYIRGRSQGRVLLDTNVIRDVVVKLTNEKSWGAITGVAIFKIILDTIA